MPDFILFAFGADSWLTSPAGHTAVAIGAIVLALGFDFVNGFNDTANACATVIYTKALKPGPAIFIAGVFNFLGALLVGTAVAQVITKIIPSETVTLSIVVAVLMAALIWNLFTWWFCIPISSSHCLIGSLFGAGIMASGMNGVAWPELGKVFAALIVSPICGFIAGGILTWLGMKLAGIKTTAKLTTSVISTPKVATLAPAGVGSSFRTEQEKVLGTEEILALTQRTQPPLMRWLHVVSSALVAFTHGSNDGQKTMGIVTLILATHFAAYGYKLGQVPFWVILACAAAIGLGTTIGGWRIIKTVGEKISKEPITHAQGFGASMATALVILIASRIGAPISTTHTLNSAVAGGTIPSHGSAKLNGGTMKTILMAWVLTVPVAATLAALCYMLTKAILS